MKSSSRTRRFGDLTRPILETHFVWKNTTFRGPAISQNCTKCCACHEKPHSNFTKYCACHANGISWLIRITYETSFTMRGASQVTLQPHQILRLPRKMNLMIDPRHIWNVIYNAQSKQSHPPTSPNTAPATKFWVQDFSETSLNCFRQYKDDSRIIRPWSEHEIVISHPPLRRPDSSHLRDAFCMKKTTFRAPAISQNVTKCWACHEKSHPNFTKYCAWHEKNALSSSLYSILSWHLFSLGIYSLLASILSWHLFSLGIYSL